MATNHLCDFIAAGLVDAAGIPLSSGKVYHYAAGTTTLKDIFTDYAGSIPAAQPIVLNAAGVAQVYGAGLYKFVVQDFEDAVIRTIDNVAIGPVLVAPIRITVSTDRQLVFTVPGYTVGGNNLRVYLDGSRLTLAAGDYTESSSTTITLSSRYAPSISTTDTVLTVEVI